MKNKPADRKLNRILVDEERCKGCGLCIIACPHNLIKLSEKFNRSGYYPALWADPDKKCRCAVPLCYVMCPDLALECEREGK